LNQRHDRNGQRTSLDLGALVLFQLTAETLCQACHPTTSNRGGTKRAVVLNSVHRDWIISVQTVWIRKKEDATLA